MPRREESRGDHSGRSTADPDMATRLPMLAGPAAYAGLCGPAVMPVPSSPGAKVVGVGIGCLIPNRRTICPTTLTTDPWTGHRLYAPDN